MALPDAAELRAAAQQLCSVVRSEREAAERVLLSGKEEATPHLVELLESPPDGGDVPVGRVALMLGALRTRDGLLPLLALATAKDTAGDDLPFVARAIAEIVDGRDAFDERVTDAIEAMAAADDRYSRAFAAQAFGALGDARARARIQALTQDDDEWVRGQADKELRRLTQSDADHGAPTMDDFASLVANANAEGGRLKPWLDDLGDGRRAVRDSAVAQLIGAGKEAVPFLIEKLNQPQLLGRIAAAQALGRLQPPEAAGPLLIAATSIADTDAELELRAVALRSLANCLTGLEEGLASSLLPLAEDNDRFVRAGALLCLGRLADREGIRAVVKALSDPDPFVVESAAIALSEGVREEDSDLVLPLLRTFDTRPRKGLSALREAILIALSRIAIDDAPLRVRVRHRVRLEVGGPTAALRKAAIALLERLYSQDDPPVLLAVDDVLARLEDEHPEVRVVAASFLSVHLEPGYTGAARWLTRALARRERTLSLLCLEALRRLDTEDARSAMMAATRSEDDAVAEQAAELLDGFEPGAEEWTFVPAPRAERAPPRGVSQRPSVQTPRRVRAVTSDGTADAEPVAAKDAGKAVAPHEPSDDGASPAASAAGDGTRIDADAPASDADSGPGGSGSEDAVSKDATADKTQSAPGGDNEDDGDIVEARFD